MRYPTPPEHISDPTVLADEAAALALSAVIAGPLADTLRGPAFSEDALDWRKTNFYKTELELGRCLRMPAESTCECDLELSCSTFVTSRQHAPRLSKRFVPERSLIAEVRERGLGREVELHERIEERISRVPRDLGEGDDEPAGNANGVRNGLLRSPPADDRGACDDGAIRRG